jgi:hypothetical protein
VTDAPLPPLADAQDVDNATDPFLELYHKLGPIYRLARQDEKPLVVLAGAEANAFTSRYGDEFFVSAELWKEFNNAMGGMAGGMTTMRDGDGKLGQICTDFPLKTWYERQKNTPLRSEPSVSIVQMT